MLIGSKPLATGAFLSGQGPDALVIDAQNMSFACPLDLAGIVATAHWAADCEIRVIFRLPSDADTAAYLQRMDVLRQMPPRTQILGRVPRDVRTNRKTLMEVTVLNEKNVNDLAEHLGRLVTSLYRGHSESAGAAIFRACSELMSNATEHGSSNQGAFIAVQHYSGSTTEAPRLEFAVCDTGIGVMQHLRGNPEHSHLTRDELAIKKALGPGVSGIGQERRGNGLSDAIEHTRHHGTVDLQIRSGKGEVLVVGTPTHHDVKPRSRPDQTVGTWAWLTHQRPNRASLATMKPEKRCHDQ